MKAMASAEQIQTAAQAIRDGRLVVFPTETVYGLGADAGNEEAVARIFAAKGRPADNPLIVHLESIAWAEAVVDRLPPVAGVLFERFSPGPLTLVLPAHPSLPGIVTAGLDTVAVRIPSHPVARALLASCGRPVAAPSANRSGEPSPTTVGMARASLERGLVSSVGGESGGITYIDGGPCEVGLESTVAAVSGRRVVILRPGSIGADDLQRAVPDAQIADAPSVDRIDRPVSPGLKHGHYRPGATVIAHDPQDESPDRLRSRILRSVPEGRATVGVIGIAPTAVRIAAEIGRAAGRPGNRRPAETNQGLVREAADAREYAHNLYRWFVELDGQGCEAIVAILPPDQGVGRALRDRITRAAGG